MRPASREATSGRDGQRGQGSAGQEYRGQWFGYDDKSSEVSGVVMMFFLSNFGFLDEFFCHFLVLQACPLAVDAAAQKI